MNGVYDLPFFPIDPNDGTNGKDGVSPTLSVENISGGHRIIIVDAIGRKTIDVMNGADGSTGPAGKDGQNGQDGISASITGVTASVDDSSGTPKVSVTAGGTGTSRTFDFAFTGLKGPTGEKGAAGEAGKDGKDGSNGVDGRGIKNIVISEGSLIVTYTDDTEVNLGKVVGEPGPRGEQGIQGETGPAYVLTDETRAAIIADVKAAVLAELELPEA